MIKINNLHYKEKDKEINMIKAGIIGSTGYAGQELVRIFLHSIRMQRLYGMDPEVI